MRLVGQKKTILVILLIASILFASYEGVRLYNDAHPNRFFIHELESNHITENVIVHGTNMAVRGNIVRKTDGTPADAEQTSEALRMAYALALATRSPLFNLEGVDPDRLARSVSELSLIEEKLADIQKNADAADAIRTSLFPIEFLRSLSILERARLQFVASGSDTDEQAYEAALASTSRAYVSNIAAFRSAYEKIVPENAGKLGVAGRRILSRQSEIAAIDALMTNARTIDKKIADRAGCISGDATACRSHDIELRMPRVAEVRHPGSPELAKEVLTLLSTASEMKLRTLPRLISLPSSACVGDSSDNLVFMARKQYAKDHHEFLAVTFVGDILLIKTEANVGTKYFDFFRSHGVAYVPYWPTSTYTCPEIGKETSDVLAARSVGRVASTSPFSSDFPADQALVALENKVANDEMLNQTDAALYVDAVGKALVRSDVWSGPTYDRFIPLVLQVRDRSAGLDDILDRLIVETDTNVRYINSEYPVELSAPYLFFARSAFFSLLLGGNRSVISDETVVPYEHTLLPAQKEPYITYSSLTDDTSKKQVLDGARFVIRLEEIPAY